MKWTTFPTRPRILACLFGLLASTFFAGDAIALQEILTVRTNSATGHTEAVIDGKSSGGCELYENTRFYSPTSVIERANVFTVSSPLEVFGCIMLPFDPYEVVADLGVLAPASYTLNWSIDSPDDPGNHIRTLSIVFVVVDGGFDEVHLAPALDARLLLVLAIFVAAIGINRMSRRRAFRHNQSDGCEPSA